MTSFIQPARVILFPDDQLAACVVPGQAGTHTPCPRGQGLWVPAFGNDTTEFAPFIRMPSDCPAMRRNRRPCIVSSWRAGPVCAGEQVCAGQTGDLAGEILEIEPPNLSRVRPAPRQ